MLSLDIFLKSLFFNSHTSIYFWFWGTNDSIEPEFDPPIFLKFSDVWLRRLQFRLFYNPWFFIPAPSHYWDVRTISSTSYSFLFQLNSLNEELSCFIYSNVISLLVSAKFSMLTNNEPTFLLCYWSFWNLFSNLLILKFF